MPSPNPRELKVANIGGNLRPRSATRDLRATLRSPGKNGSQFDDRLRLQLTNQQMGATGKHVRVFPARAEFRDTEPNVTHVLSITVVNRSDNVRRIRFKPPTTAEFTLHQIPSISVAPGLEISADLEYFSGVEGDFSDELVVMCEEDKILVPVRAYAPRADLFFDGFCHFGGVAPESMTIRYVDVVNKGTKAADFKFLQDKVPHFEIEPMMGRLGPAGSDDCFIRVRVVFHAKNLGMFRSVVQMEVNSKVIGTLLDMSALVVRQQVQLVSPDGTGKLDALNFGTVYFGEERSQQITFVNDGTEPLEFKSTVPRPESDDNVPLDPVFTISPAACAVVGFEQKLLTVKFHPPPENMEHGWKVAKDKDGQQMSLSKVEHNVQATFNSSGSFDPKLLAELTASLKLVGRAVSVQVTLSEYHIEFVDTKQSDHVDVSLVLKNHHEELPIAFSVPHIAQFRCRPAAGRLLPFQSTTLVLSFCPNNRGTHSASMNFILQGASGQIVGTRTVTLIGTCHDDGKKKKLGGLLATAETFSPKLTIQGPDQLEKQKATIPQKFVREKAWVKRPPEVSSATIKYTMEVDAFEKIAENKEQYVGWLREEQAKRKGARTMTETVAFALGNPADVACGDPKEDPDYAKPSLDMGMFGVPVKGAPAGLALNEPKLALPEANEPLYLKSNFGIKTVLKPRSRIVNEDRLLVTKFKPQPTNARERRESQLNLNARNILQISTHPAIMAFGAICIQQNNAKSFTVQNDTEGSILVRIDTHGNGALSRSKPESQVIPPGKTAGFDIVLYLDSTAEISTKFTYVINEHHFFEVPITGQAVPVMLSLNKSTINFIFPPQSFAPSVSESLILMNQGKNLAEYKISQGKYFTTIPNEGIVDPLQSQEVVISFRPGMGTLFEETLAIEVLGGSPMELTCSGEVSEGKLKVKGKSLDYGAMAAGVAVRKSFTIVGDADSETESDTIWYVDSAEISRKCPGLSVTPERGSLARGISAQIVATIRSERAQDIDSSFQIMVRGGKPFKMKVKAQIVVPVAKVLNEEFDFGSTYLGATTVRKLKISNTSPVGAVFTLDLRKHFEFDFKVPEELEFEDDDKTSDDESKSSLASLKGMGSSMKNVGMKEHLDDPNQDSEGPLSNFCVPANSEVELDLTFSPVSLMNHAFELPLSMQGLPPNAMRPLRRAVCAESVRPRLLLSISKIDFGTKVVVNKNMGSFAYHLSLSATNCDDHPCMMEAEVKGEHADSGIFMMKSQSVNLVVGRSCPMSIDFIPRDSVNYACKLMIYIDGVKDKPYFELEVHGVGVHPSIKFDRREVLLAPTPPGVPQKVSFFVINNGFDNLDLQYDIAADSKHLPINVSFPNGTMLNVVRQRIPVELVVSPESSMSFTGIIQFFDNKGQVYKLPIICTADASITSNFPWLSLHTGCYAIEVQAGKPHMLNIVSQLMDTDLDEMGNICYKTPGSPVQGSPSRNKPALVPNAAFLCACKEITDQKSLDFLLEYCNMAVFKQAINKFPADIHGVRGKMIIDIIQESTGKAVPGQIKKIAASRKEEAVQTLNLYKEMCNFLKLYGAFIDLVRPEYLLPFQLFEKLYLDVKTPEVASYSTETFEFLEQHYPIVHKASWLIIVYQVIRLFVLSRYTPKTIKAYAGIDPKKYPALHTTGSNVFSSNEMCLLSWLTYHYQKVNPSEKAPVSNFDKDLHDCRVFAAAISSHIPSVTSTLAMLKKTDSEVERLANAKTLKKVMKELNLDYCPSEVVLTSAPGRDLILFVAYLVDSLPGFIPKITVEFEGRLNEPVIKHIELTNPSARPLIYNVRIDGSPEFSANDSLKIAPRDKVKFPVKCLHTQRLPAVGNSTEAQIFFIGERVPGSPMGATLVFNLKSEVKSFKRTQIFTKETRLYEQISFEVPCENTSAEEDTKVQVTLVSLNTWPTSHHVSDAPTAASSPVKKGQSKPPKKIEATSSHLLPKMTFWAKKSDLRLKKNTSAVVTVNFLPLRLAPHSCLVFIQDDFGCEKCYELQVKVSLPNQTDFFKFAHPMKSTIVKDLPLTTKNPAIDKCRAAIMEFMGKNEGAAFFKAVSDQNRLDCKVEFLSEGFTGPRDLTLWVKPPQGLQLEKGQKPNNLQLELRPTGVGLYATRLVLRSALHIRILDIEAKVTSLGTRAELTLSIPARQQILQEIPVINNSDYEWKVIADLQGEGFSGPKDLTVPPKKDGQAGKAFYPLLFKPKWICKSEGLLNLRNTTADDKYEYSLTGIGEDPVSEDNFKVQCKARQRTTLSISVRNILPDDDCLYDIECDLIGMTGPAQHKVLLGEKSDYELTIKMPRGGEFTGSISFVAPNKHFIWFTVEIVADNPPSERTVELQTKPRSAVAADITIVNPLNSEITFDVIMQGEGLFGPSSITLAPRETAIYELIYSPLLVGFCRGGLTFLNDEIGEFWYSLELTAVDADPMVLEEIEVELGKNASTELTLENPLGEDIELTVNVSNPTNFHVVTEASRGKAVSTIPVAAYSSLVAQLVYTASALQEEETAVIALSHHEAGMWEYHCSGRGTAPEEPADVIRISAMMGFSSSKSVEFCNPFKTQLLANFVLTGKDTTVPEDAPEGTVAPFRLALSQINNVMLDPFEKLELPVVFVPLRMAEHKCVLQVHATQHGIKWSYPFVGTAEAATAINLGRLQCKARESLMEYLDLNLDGALDLGERERLDLEVVTPQEHADMLSKSLTIERDPAMPRPKAGVCRVRVVFEPLKAVRCKVQVLITRPSGGRWRFDLELVALQPDVDDLIKIEGIMNRPSSVSFRMTNQFDKEASFKAYFSVESPPEFTVTPTEGMLEAYGSEGTNFIVSFTPKVYGKFYKGRLVVETEEMQWTYEVHGNLPTYDPPRAAGKVDTWLGPEADPALYKTRQPPQNYMQQNLQNVRQMQASLASQVSSPTRSPSKKNSTL